MKEEFAVYGLPGWFMVAVGILKLSFATLLLSGVWLPVLTTPGAIGMAVLMAGAVTMHLKVGDPLMKALPSVTLLVLSFVVAIV
ncbi:MAG: DoxX family protein [Phycisphaerales bacterium]|nr:MAG: DoxX family protein [Phycisphaerales bacterium]